MSMYLPSRKINGSNGRFMRIYGNSKLSVRPTVSKVQLGVEVRNLNANTAQQENSRAIHQITQAFLKLGLSPSNIQTSEYSIFPVYDFIDGNQQFKGYQVTHLLSLTIENLEQTGKVIDTAVQNGANRILDIQFTTKHMEAYYQKSLTIALENSLTKARVIAKTMQLNLDPTPAQITEQLLPPPPIPFQTLSATAETPALLTPVQPGRIEIEAKVEVVYCFSS